VDSIDIVRDLDEYGQDGILSDTVREKIGYQAPEIGQGECYDRKRADIFACGVILFAMVTGVLPFQNTNKDDPFFRFFITNKERFWGYHQKSRPLLNKAFIDLIDGILHPDPNQRYKMDQIKQHPWLQDPVENMKTISGEFNKLKQEMKSEERTRKHRAMEVRYQEDFGNLPGFKPECYRGGSDLERNIDKMIESADRRFGDDICLNRNANTYYDDGIYKLQTEIIVFESIETVFKLMLMNVLAVTEQYTVPQNGYKISNVRYMGDNDPFIFNVEVFKKDDETSVVSFSKNSGELLTFHKMIEEKFKKFIKCVTENHFDRNEYYNSMKIFSVKS